VSATQTAQPGTDDAALAHEALVRVRRFLADRSADDRPVEIRVTGERETLTVPRPAVDLLCGSWRTWPPVGESRSCPRTPS